MNRKKTVKKILICLAVLLLAVLCATGIYLGMYYHASDRAVRTAETQALDVQVNGREMLFFGPESVLDGNEIKAQTEEASEEESAAEGDTAEEASAEQDFAEENAMKENTAEEDAADTAASVPALIFYPGGKVQYEAYAPLCRELADRGILCALVKMPFRLAVFAPDAASDAVEYVKETFGCEDIYIGGHSLGGVMAADYASSHEEQLKGVLFLACIYYLINFNYRVQNYGHCIN